jgi:hypothetical protein
VFDVYIDKPVDATPAGRAKLAAAMAARYKLPEQQIATYLASKRFRVKANLDERTARALAKELEAMGAVVSVFPAGATATTAPPPPVTGISATVAMPPPAGAGRPQRYVSGLGAAFDSSASKAQELGALEQGSLSLSSLDGADDAAAAPASPKLAPASQDVVGRDPFGPPDGDEKPLMLLEEPPAPAPSAKKPPLPAPKPVVAAAAPPPRPRTADAFAPPDAEDKLLELDGPVAAKKPAAPPPIVVPPPGPTASMTMRVRPMPAPGPAPSKQETGASLAARFADKPRQQWLAGCVLALIGGAIPAQLYASTAGKTYDAIRAEVSKTPPADDAAYRAVLDEHETAVNKLHSAQQHVELTAGALWILVGGLVAAGWIKLSSA